MTVLSAGCQCATFGMIMQECDGGWRMEGGYSKDRRIDEPTPRSSQDHVRVLRASSDGGDPVAVASEGALVDE